MFGDKNIFSRLNKPKRFLDYKFGTFDIETTPDSETGSANAKNFKFGVVFDGLSHSLFTDPKEMFRFMTQKKYTGFNWYAHNGEYDINGIVESIPKDLDVNLFSGSRLIVCGKLVYDKTSKKGKRTRRYIYFKDSMNYFQSSLESIGEAIGYPKLEFNQEAINNMSSQAIDYCKRDCEIVYKALDLFFELGRNEFNINPRLTIASTALAIFRTNFLDKNYYVDKLDINFKNSYFGGRTEVFKKELKNGRCYDYNSLYPSAMINNNFPNPSQLKRAVGNTTVKSIVDNNKFEGVALVVVSTDLHIPILPVHQDNKNIFPRGVIKGWYNFNELRFALKNGYELIEYFECVYSEGIPSPFQDYVETLYRLRQEYKNEGSSFQVFVKYLLNSLYGKLGEKREIKVLGKQTDNPNDLITLPANITGYWAFEEIGNSGFGYHVLKNEMGFTITTYPEHTVFAWCSYVTSYARITLYKGIQSIDYDVAYCDTDSIFTTHELEDSKKLGELGLEYSFELGEFVKPKHYAITGRVDAKGNTLPDIGKIKGIRGVTAEDIFKTEHTNDTVVKTKQSLVRKLIPGTSLRTTKRISLFDNKRIWKDNKSYPIEVSME